MLFRPLLKSSPPKPPLLVFHVGLEKTGTTSFQRFCFENRKELEATGVLYPRYRARVQINHKVIAASYLPKTGRDYTVAIFLPDRARVVGAVRREVAKSKPHTVLISAEHLSSRFDEACAKALAADFANFDCRIIVVLRDVHARFLSAYSTSIMSGRHETLEEYANEVLDPRNPYLRLPQTLAPWRKAFGDDRITLVDYDDVAPDIIGSLLHAAGLSVPKGLKVGYRERPSMSVEGLLTLRLCNTMLRQRQNAPRWRSFPLWAQHAYFSRACKLRILNAPSTGSIGAWQLGSAQMEQLERIAETERDFLQTTFDVVKKRPAQPSRIVVNQPIEEGAARQRRAEAIVRSVTRFRWTFSQAIVAAALAGQRAVQRLKHSRVLF